MHTVITIDGACRLDVMGVIRASGADAAAFLQGQLTNDVANLSAGRARLAGFCSAKGRLQATFVVWREGTEDFLLACPTDLLASTLKRLSMFVLRAKCRLSDASSELALWGMVGASAASRLEGAATWGCRVEAGATAIRLPDAEGMTRALLAVSANASAPDDVAVIGIDDWRWLDVRSGIVTIEAATVDRFVPQMVNFELVGGVDFKKGCYPGQEVVARSQYRGTTKRRAFLFDCDALPRPGDDVFASDGPGDAPEAVGTVATAAAMPDGGGASALVEVRLAALGAGDLRLGSTSGPALRQVALPYPVAVEAEPAA